MEPRMSSAHDSKPKFSAFNHTPPILVTAEGMITAALGTVKQHISNKATPNVLFGYASDGDCTCFCRLDSPEEISEAWAALRESRANMWFMIQYAFGAADVVKLHLLNSCAIAVGYTGRRCGKPVGLIGLILDGDFLPIPAKLTKMVGGAPHFALHTAKCFNELRGPIST
jgi:hypothetical protein